MDSPEKGAKLIDDGHSLLSELGESSVSTVAAVNAIAYGGGCELSMACDFRVAAESAVFGQPEINLGIIPGFGGTQRLPRLVGQSKALEMNLTGDAVLAPEAREYGLADDLVPDEQLLDVALSWATQARRPRRRWRSSRSSSVSNKGDLDDGIAAEKEGFAKVFQSEDGTEGIRAFLGKRQPQVEGQVATRERGSARGAHPRVRVHRRPDRRRDLGALGDSGLPDARHGALGERGPDGGRAHRRVSARIPAGFWEFYRPRLHGLGGVEPEPGPRGAGRARAPRAARGRDHAEHRHAPHARGLRARRRGARLDPHRELPGLRRDLRAGRRRGALRRGGGGRRAAPARAWSSPTSSSSARCCRPRRWPRPRRSPSRADLLLCVGSSLEVYPVAGPAVGDDGRAAAGSRSSRRARRPSTSDAAVRLDGDVVAELDAVVAALLST